MRTKTAVGLLTLSAIGWAGKNTRMSLSFSFSRSALVLTFCPLYRALVLLVCKSSQVKSIFI